MRTISASLAIAVLGVNSATGQSIVLIDVSPSRTDPGTETVSRYDDTLTVDSEGEAESPALFGFPLVSNPFTDPVPLYSDPETDTLTVDGGLIGASTTN